MVNYVNDARLTTLNLVELSGLDKSTVSRQLKHAIQHNFLQNKVMKSTNVKVLLKKDLPDNQVSPHEEDNY
ncbi:hypothetical protein OGM84_11055 [Pediococcus acidilactici]